MVATVPRQPTKTWTSVLLGGKSVRVNSDYHDERKRGWHTGVDLAASTGTSIKAPIAGVVQSAGWDNGWGYNILIKLDTGDYMFLAHMSSLGVKSGGRIGVGDFLGKTGNTGSFSQGAHLHIEIRRKSSGGHWARQDSYFYEPIAYLNEHAGKSRLTGTSGSTSAGGSGYGSSGGTGGAGSSTSSSGGGGGGTGAVAFSKKDFYAKLEAMFGDLDTLMNIDAQAIKEHGGKSIRWAIDEAVKQKITDSDRFLTLLNQTAWFKKYGQETTRRLIEEKSKPELFKTAVGQIRDAIAQEAGTYGLTLSAAALTQLARDAYVYQWSANSATVLDRLQATKGIGVSGGSIGEAYEKLDEMGYLYGVAVSEADRTQLRNDILDGKGQQAMLDRIQERSAQKYAPYADDIRKGTNLRTLIQPYLDVAQNLLEVSDASLDMDDPLFKNGNGFQTVDQKTGKVVVRPLSEFEKMVRQDPRWVHTTNARDTAMKATANLLTTMGLI